MGSRRSLRESRPQVCAIAGTGQNGATLLCRLIGELPGAVAVGEVGRLWEKGLGEDVECSCGERFSRCPFWNTVGQRAFGGWDQIDVTEARRLATSLPLGDRRLPHPFALPLILFPWLSPRYRRDLRAYAELMGRLYAAILDVSGATVVIDSMKVPAHIYMLAKSDAVSVRFVHLVRDPRGVAFSNTKLVARQGSRLDKPMRTRRSPRKTATKWLWFNMSFELLRLARHPFLRVKYEELVEDPGRSVEACAGYLGLDGPESLSFLHDHVAELSAGHLVAGNRMRHEVGPIEIRLDEAWRRGLPEDHRRLVEWITVPLRGRYGYRRDRAMGSVRAGAN